MKKRSAEREIASLASRRASAVSSTERFIPAVHRVNKAGTIIRAAGINPVARQESIEKS